MECLDLFLNRPNTRLLMGNHDEYFAFGVPEPQPVWMSDNEWTHQQWTNAQLDAGLRDDIASWPYTYELALGEGTAHFCHYARRADDSDFASIINEPSPSDLDRLFGDEAEVNFYGHHHPRSDVRGASRYINPGALGCNSVPEARFAILTIAHDDSWEVELHAVPYDRSRLIRAYRDVPAAHIWGELAANTNAAGYAIGVPDIMIAATALHHGMHVVTRNAKDFEPTGVLLLNPWEDVDSQTSSGA